MPFKKISKLFNWQLFLIIIYLIAMVPFLSFIGFPSILKNLQIPNFIVDELLKMQGGVFIYFIILIFLIYLNIRLIFVLPIIVTTDNSVTQAIKLSRQITKKHLLKFISQIIVFGLIGSGLLLLVTLVVIIITSLLLLVIPKKIIVNMSLSLISLIIFCFISYIKLSVYSFLVYIMDAENIIGKDISKDYIRDSQRKGKKLIKLGLVIFFIGKFIVDTFTYSGIIYTKDTKIVAHRGYTAASVENTIEALEDAAKYKADYVELDIMQTKDNKLVVIHDYNLKRLANKNIKVSDLTLEELQKIKLTQNGNTGYIPSFKEYIEKSKKIDIKLMIELKPNKIVTESFYNELIGDIVDSRIEDTAVITSLEKNVLDGVRKRMPELTLGYIIPFQFGNLGDYGYDFYVMEEMSYTNRVRLESSARNIPVYVWTVNEPSQIRKYILEGTYGIITDDLYTAEEFNKDMSSQDLIDYFLNKLVILE